MADINKRLLTAQGDIPAPQHKKKGESNFEFTEGSHGAQHTKIVDASGQPADIDAELKSIKRTQAEILDRLDNGIDTRVTGSIVEEIQIHVDADSYNDGHSWHYFGTNRSSGPSSVKPIDVRPYRNKSILIKNNDNLTLSGLRVYGMFDYRNEDDSNLNRDDFVMFYFDIEEEVDSGELLYITSDDYPDLEKISIGLLLRTNNKNNDETTGKGISVYFYGSRS